MKITMNSKIFANYTKGLVNRLYKILPLFEEKNEGLFAYVQSLILELEGLYWTIPSIQDNEDYLILVATLESISDYTLMSDENDHPIIKREVFKCIEVLSRLSATKESGE